MTPLDVQARFVYTFAFRRSAAKAAEAALCAAEVAGFAQAWERAGPLAQYRDELVDHVAAYLFSDKTRGPRVRTLRLGERATNRIFRGLVAHVKGKDELPVELVRPAGCELFLSSQGVGVLSISLSLEGGSSLERALEFNYLAIRQHGDGELMFQIPHPASDAERWRQIPEANRREIAPAPAADAPAASRIGAAGGSFSLSELADLLLKPLAAHGLRVAEGARSTCGAPMVFAVARFGADVDFDGPDSVRAMSPLIGAMAQVEEPLHAGAPTGNPGVPSEILNRKHWAGVGMLGCAHLVADQVADAQGTAPEFNNQRVSRVFHKYFVPYLLAVLQRTTLQRALDDAGAVLAAVRPAARERRLRRLRAALLEFGVRGNFTQVSTRHALHRYYDLARRGLGVPTLWSEVRQAVADLDAQQTAISQKTLTQGMSQGLARSNRMQEALHVIEVFLVAVYSAHLVLMLLETVHPILEHHHELKRWVEWSGPALVGGAALIGYLLTRRMLRAGGH
ncbi:MAG: hypothetical protein HZB56_22680 [Deltaproteobacteria bacterium]|nr:hypothetical protein [Deltaproteobacteria bacterium]